MNQAGMKQETCPDLSIKQKIKQESDGFSAEEQRALDVILNLPNDHDSNLQTYIKKEEISKIDSNDHDSPTKMDTQSFKKQIPPSNSAKNMVENVQNVEPLEVRYYGDEIDDTDTDCKYKI